MDPSPPPASRPATSPTPPPARRRRRLLLGLALGALALPPAALAGDGLRDERGAAEVGVVLGNKVYPSGQPSPMLVDRLESALRLWRAGRVERLVVSGALGKEGHDEARVMAAYLVQAGVPRERVSIDSEGWTTAHTARNAARSLGEGERVLVVTSWYHVPRAKLALRRAGVAVAGGVGTPVRGYPKEAYGFLRELPAWLYYRFRGDLAE